MEARLEEPADREELAGLAGLSLRQLERLFSSHLGETIGECYLRIRLEKGAELLRNTGMTITVISVTCDFRTAAISRAHSRLASGGPQVRSDTVSLAW